ncbi:Dna2/Cas4 domain-containing protein [Facklamia lactis]|uniref:CRISPR-associated protein Cas4 n=1 Tax=Facklamia lactis TaxID=2749967 RepID=UPI0018CEAFA6|nr:Dna2/Cas4 domain-containing protein [Facklamia lactis]
MFFDRCFLLVKFSTLDDSHGIFYADGNNDYVEYKKGKEKINDVDKLQLAAQAICLEKMYQIHIEESYLYYFSTNNRILVSLTD